MVKLRPRIPDRAARRRHRFDNKLRAHHRQLLKLASFSSPPSSSIEQPTLPIPTNTTTTSTTQEITTTTTQKSPATPSSLSIRRKVRNFMKRSKLRSRSTSKSPSSPSQSQSHSLSPSLSCSSSSPPKISLSPLTFSSPDLSPSPPTLPPLPPQPSPELLRRCISDPVTLSNHLSGDIHNFTPKSSSSRPVSRNLMGQLPPLPPSSSSSPSNLRRTISDPVSSLSPTYKDENAKRMKKEETVAVEKLSGEWVVVNFNCECGKDGKFLVNAADKKHFKLT